MIWIVIVLLWSSVSFGQAVEISAVSYSIVSGATMAYIIKDRDAYRRGNLVYRDYQKTWRVLLPVEAISLINVGFAIAIEDRKRWDLVVTDLFLVGAIRWLVRDGVYQTLQGKPFFELPNTEWTYFPGIEKLGSAFFKIALVSTILVFKYFILPIL
jgi:hypothetical protein